MVLLETDDQLTIVNRSKEHRISKELIRKVPYFEKMLSHELLESKENKVVLDFDEKAFKIILDWVERDCTIILIEMSYVINLCNIADYLGMNNNLIKDCFNYFYKKFSIRHLTAIIHQVTPTSKLVNSSAINAFICRHFLMISSSTVWLSYPLKTIEYICKLDLMISSEIQVFDAIMKWVNANAESRKFHLKALLNLVRWCHMEPKHLSSINKNDLIKSENFQPTLCYPTKIHCDCDSNRVNQKYIITIEELSATDLRIKVLDRNFIPLMNKVIKLDESMPLRVLHDEHISDIVLDSGRSMIRIDWKQAKGCFFDTQAYVSYYLEICKCTNKSQNGSKYQKSTSWECCSNITGSLLFEANGKFILAEISDRSISCQSDPTASTLLCHYFDFGHGFIATISDQSIYILTKNFEFIKFNFDDDKDLYITELEEKLEESLNFDDLFLTSNQANQVLLLDKSKRNVFCFNIDTQEWSQIGLLTNYECKNIEGQQEPKLRAFTSALLPIDAIRSCLKRKLDSIDDDTYDMKKEFEERFFKRLFSIYF